MKNIFKKKKNKGTIGDTSKTKELKRDVFVEVSPEETKELNDIYVAKTDIIKEDSGKEFQK